jgi:hypothetical protein
MIIRCPSMDSACSCHLVPENMSYAHKRVEVRQHLDGRLEVRYQGQRLAIFTPQQAAPLRVKNFTPLPEHIAGIHPPEPAPAQPPKPRPVSKPAADHPWRRPLLAKRSNDPMQKNCQNEKTSRGSKDHPGSPSFGVTPIILRLC